MYILRPKYSYYDEINCMVQSRYGHAAFNISNTFSHDLFIQHSSNLTVD